MQIIRWQGTEQPQEYELRSRMQREGLAPYSWSNGPGYDYAVHSHTYEKVLYCVRGSIRFVLPDRPENSRAIDLAAGDCMILPAHIRHSAHVGPHGVICLEATR
ncbi:MAG TPA: AraC family ligand binding domain-containing protein [Ktedonobacteraceae bacterium]|nr:AraC family ligand binding domain-containing protein [Ktedonobacteraceae bacterium]